MDMNRLDLRSRQSGSVNSEESALDMERNFNHHPSFPSSSPSPFQPLASGGQHSESNAAYFSWPTSSHLNDAAEFRANYFGNLQKGVLPEIFGRAPTGQQATTLLELMTIRAFHSTILRRFSLGTAIGFRIQRGALTDRPAILVFVARKVHRQWLSSVQCLPEFLQGPGGVWCDLDVVEFSYFGVPAPTPKEQLFTELIDGLTGSDPSIGSGSQVASQKTYGTLGAIVKSRTGTRQVGFLTNRHVAVDLDYPSQKMFHPLPPSLGPGVYLGAVERATSFITDELWYGIFAGTNPETFVRADGAFIPFAEDLNMNNVTTSVKGVGDIGDVHVIDLQSPTSSLIGRKVVKVGRSSGLTTGTIMAYALEYNDENGICFFTDFLVVGENQLTFDLEGDSGSLILLTGHDGEKPRPVGIIWGGTANRGRLKLKVGQPPENWTSGVDLGRLLDLLELDIITSDEELLAAMQYQRNGFIYGIDSTVEESSPPDRMLSRDRLEENFESFDLNTDFPEHDEPSQGLQASFISTELQIDGIIKSSPNKELQFIPSSTRRSPVHINDQQEKPGLLSLSSLRNDSDGEMHLLLQLGEPEPKRRRHTEPVDVQESE